MSDFDRYSLTIARWLTHVYDASNPAGFSTTPRDVTHGSPREILSTLVLSREANAKKAADTLGLTHGGEDAIFLDTLLWKLGFVPNRRPDIRDNYWKNHATLEKFVASATAATDPTEEALRSVASNYFVALERHLFDSLIFVTWALLTDHSTSGRLRFLHEATITSTRRFLMSQRGGLTKSEIGSDTIDRQRCLFPSDSV